jgi:hypothetical protein
MHPLMTNRAKRVRLLAKRRKSRGAVVFIVAATLALLALMGVYAISGAAAEVRSSGYVRQSTQAHYLSEYTMGAVANHVNSTNADFLVNNQLLAQATNPFPPTTDCLSVPTYTAASAMAKACVRINQSDIEGPWASRPLLTEHSLGQPGKSLMQGTVFAEFSNPTLTQPPPGFDQNLGLSFARITVTTGGSVQPAGNATGRTLEMGRARMIVGPVRRN